MKKNILICLGLLLVYVVGFVNGKNNATIIYQNPQIIYKTIDGEFSMEILEENLRTILNE